MSGLDIYEDGFPHSTKEGYARGCKGGSCPGIVDYGFSCRQAEVRYHGDYAFAKLVDAGKSPAEIVEIERAALPEPVAKEAPAKRKLTASGDTPITPSITVADSVEPIPAPKAVEAAPVEVIGKNGQPIPLEKHGTPQGYWAGCRERACPGLKGEHGQSCRQAIAKYQVEYQRQKREEKGRVAPADDVDPELVAETPVVVPFEVPQAQLEGVRAEGLLTDLANARERVAQLEAELAVYQRDPSANEQVVMTLSFIKGRLSAVKVS